MILAYRIILSESHESHYTEHNDPLLCLHKTSYLFISSEHSFKKMTVARKVLDRNHDHFYLIRERYKDELSIRF